ncbi:MAG: aldehyde-activating protein [Sphingomonadales bacterium 32-68-7]|nr:MAG: aldehyde-activating protein [Sphingomonadales bacterium 12-68-11]OYX08190.1 MAG: aldehyde-activating protein [Sphingomonadales bacterium 32-68-7]
MDIEREGGCGCGAVRYRVTGEPIFVNNCHCRLCQQQTGSTSVVNAFFESEQIALLQGTLSDHAVTTGSGGQQTIKRCTNCGTAVWSHYPRLGGLGTGLRVGTLDDPGAWTPDAVIFTDSAMPWVAFPEGIPAFATVYNQMELLPPERVARLQAMIERRKAGEG